jgi:glutaredoxin
VKRSRAGALLVALAMAAGGEGCRRSHASVAKDPAESSIVVRADSEGLLLTWIDDKGDFHVETRVPDVPMMGRDAVRVVDPNRDDGTHADNVFVVDLRQARADGTYPVRGMTRAEFEAFAVARREKVGPTLGGGPTQAPSSSTAQDAPEPGPARPSARAVVVIYGAEWCGACHDAARYLRSKGIAYVEKDIDKDPAAAREMQEKLAKRGLRGGSIPVLDVRGKVMIGFNPAEIDAALGDAL